MAAKVGGIYVSLALNTAEFSGGVDKSVAEMRKFDKLQADMGKAVGRVNAQISQQATVMAQLALQGTKLGPMIALLASGTQQYYQAMKRAAGENAAFSKSGAGVSALLQSMKANWIALTIQIAKYGIDKILEAQLKKAQAIAEQARAMADAMDATVQRRRGEYKSDLEDQYNAKLGIEKKITINDIAEEAIRTQNYEEGRRKASELIAKDYAEKMRKAEKTANETRADIARLGMSDTEAAIVDINKKYDELIDKAGQYGTVEEFNAAVAQINAKRKKEISEESFKDLQRLVDAQAEAYNKEQARIAEVEQKRLTLAQKVVQAWRDQIALATRYAGLVSGKASGAYSAMLGSAEAFGRIPGMPAMASAGGSAYKFDTKTMEGYLQTIARAAKKELKL